MNWAQERDLLIAETMTFVRSITGKTPDLDARIETRIEVAAVDDIAKVERPIEIVRAPRPLPPHRGGFREEIQGRVAAFRAHQQLFDRERDAYARAVLSRVRASGPDAPTRPAD
jgi:hypothetical protein